MSRPRKLVLKPHGLFATPNSFRELTDWCLAHSGGERTVAVTAAMMAWNLAADQVRRHNEGLDRVDLQNPYAHIDPDKEEQ